MTDEKILAAIGSTEPSTFVEFCKSLGSDCPEKGDTSEWPELFANLEYLEHQKLVTIERDQRRIESLQLTDAGADRVRAELDKTRGLFSGLE